MTDWPILAYQSNCRMSINHNCVWKKVISMFIRLNSLLDMLLAVVFLLVRPINHSKLQMSQIANKQVTRQVQILYYLYIMKFKHTINCESKYHRSQLTPVC